MKRKGYAWRGIFMSTYVPVAASGSTFGNCPIMITSTSSTSAQTIHTCSTSTGANSFDEVYMKATNVSSTGAIGLYIQLGSSSLYFYNGIASLSGWVPILLGERFNSGLVIAAYANTTNAIIVHAGTINRVSS